MKQLIIAIKATLVLTLVTGVVYPLLVTGLAKTLFRHQADGSLIQANGRTIGSELIGQRFTKPEYFHGRPSAAGNDGYDGAASSGSNLGPTNQKLADRVKADVQKFRAGMGPVYAGFSARNFCTSAFTRSASFWLVGPRFDPLDAAPS